MVEAEGHLVGVTTVSPEGEGEGEAEEDTIIMGAEGAEEEEGVGPTTGGTNHTHWRTREQY